MDSSQFQKKYYKHLPYRLKSPDKEGEYPLIVFLHGAGERGRDNEKQLTWCVAELVNWLNLTNQQAYILVPQCAENERWVDTDWSALEHKQADKPTKYLHAVMELVNELVTEQSINPKRIYGMGISMGGFGIWDWMTRDPHRFAAAIPICGGVDTSVLHHIKEIPIWIFHGSLDTIVWSSRSRDAYQTLEHLGSNSCKFTEFPETAHNCWTKVCADSSVFEWLFNQQKE